MNRALVMKEKLYRDVIRVPFEDGLAYVPIGYDGILRMYYGNYMQAILADGAHGYPFYRRYEEELRENFGLEFFRYHPDPASYDPEGSGHISFLYIVRWPGCRSCKDPARFRSASGKASRLSDSTGCHPPQEPWHPAR